MEYKVNYTLVGSFVLLLTLLLVLMAYWLSSGRHSKDYNTYLVYMSESVYGLSEQSPVKFNGVAIGYVEKITLDKEDLQKVVVVLEIDKNVPITESIYASLKAQGITGITFIGLKAESPNASLLKAKPGEEYPIIPSKPSLLVQLGDALRTMSTTLETLGGNFQKIFNDENTQAVKNSLHNIEGLTETLADNTRRIDNSVKLAERLLENSAEASKRLPDMAKRVDSALKSMIDASDEIKLTMISSRATIQAVSQQAIPSAIQLLNRLDSISANIQQLSAELQQNPSMLVRGRAPRVKGPGER